ncbi:hypothetical protein [Yersinia sp. KBS0713]|uniref:hypothetical protein n=1 Tax=Yersinia sp. KBS0713 TaxID=1179669 RepID=UPI0016439976|nr:hypothetical protein [Yersinia sp. KBS0713]
MAIAEGDGAATLGLDAQGIHTGCRNVENRQSDCATTSADDCAIVTDAGGRNRDIAARKSSVNIVNSWNHIRAGHYHLTRNITDVTRVESDVGARRLRYQFQGQQHRGGQ